MPREGSQNGSLIYNSGMTGPIVTKVRCARAHVQMFPSVSYLGNGWTDCAEVWYTVRDQLGRQFTQTKVVMHLYVRAYVPLFRILGTAGRVAEIRKRLKFVM